MVQVKVFYAENELRNFSYLIYDDKTAEAWIVDPYEASPIIDYIQKNALVLQGILNTHQHHDHIRGNIPLIETFHSRVKKLSNHEKIKLNEKYQIESLDTPGHTLDHQAFLLNDGEKTLALFSGDTLFNAGVGNCKMGGDVELLFETTKHLLRKLPSSTILYPGHDYIKRNLEFALNLEPQNQNIHETLRRVKDEEITQRRHFTLGEERLLNPFLRLDSEEIRQRFKNEIYPLENGNEIERNLFKKIRKLRDVW